MNKLPNTIGNLLSVLDSFSSDHNMQMDRPYSGQAHTSSGTRGATQIKGLTFRDLRDCYIRSIILSSAFTNGEGKLLEPNATLHIESAKGPNAVICENDLSTLKGNIDPIAIFQNLSCEIEKVMGIFPNVPGREKETWS